MFPLPHTFDLNEWFVLASSAILLALFFLLPRRFPRYFTVMNFLFLVFLVMSVDDVLALKPYDYYDWMDDERFELFDALTYFLLYPQMGYFFLYFYDRWNLRGPKLVLYMLGWTCISIGYEWLSVKAHVLIYKGWSLWYSIPVYLVVFGLQLGFFHIYKKEAVHLLRRIHKD
ncbi:hypothetical protein JJB07_12350 [Tumebacillus sp. ITR2]|uniref:EXPERA domain-containing protein n=1 Tax=Tumebacillus amylolyticus TaxID=2801339 RepID=A0ABS1JAZ2_9BACL|nr:hypothetical protein [Tumebacillus amylolyticus]MBL0387444.1 hypothetical protein [Tumebacillus amylolyticus]